MQRTERLVGMPPSIAARYGAPNKREAELRRSLLASYKRTNTHKSFYAWLNDRALAEGGDADELLGMVNQR